MTSAATLRRLWGMAARDFRLRSVSWEAALLWAPLMEAIGEHGSDGVLAIGMDLSLTQLARIVCVDVVRLEAVLDELAAKGLIGRAHPHLLALPKEARGKGSARRAQASRENGARGGRPRKTLTSADAG